MLRGSPPASEELPAIFGVSQLAVILQILQFHVLFSYIISAFPTCISTCDQISFRVLERKLSRACWIYWGDSAFFLEVHLYDLLHLLKYISWTFTLSLLYILTYGKKVRFKYSPIKFWIFFLTECFHILFSYCYFR